MDCMAFHASHAARGVGRVKKVAPTIRSAYVCKMYITCRFINI